MQTNYYKTNGKSKPLRAIIEVRAGKVEISAVSHSDAETSEIFEALEKFIQDLRENSR
jgi:hypothetical protein